MYVCMYVRIFCSIVLLFSSSSSCFLLLQILQLRTARDDVINVDGVVDMRNDYYDALVVVVVVVAAVVVVVVALLNVSY